jgi:hypothetical protein
MPELALNPLLEALKQATPTERKTITKALNTLARLLAQTSPSPTTTSALEVYEP